MNSNSATQSKVIAKNRPFPLLTALAFSVLAFSVVYMVGLEQMPMLHNAFHDLRHATGFPCH